MREARVQELDEMAVRLLATALQLPQGGNVMTHFWRLGVSVRR